MYLGSRSPYIKAGCKIHKVHPYVPVITSFCYVNKQNEAR